MIVLPEDKKIIELLSPSDAQLVLLALLSTGDDMPELTPMANMAYTVIRSKNDRISEQKSRYSSAQSEKGKRGGAPVGNQNARKQAESSQNKPEQAKQTESNQIKPTDTESVTVSVSETATDTGVNTTSMPAVADEEAAVARSEQVPYGKIIEHYNTICTRLRKIRNIDGERKKSVTARYKKYGLDTLITLFEKANASEFLCGGGSKNWTADFDWLMNATNIAKVLEGKYDARINSPPDGPGSNMFFNYARELEAEKQKEVMLFD